jgi:hypothetical protein
MLDCLTNAIHFRTTHEHRLNYGPLLFKVGNFSVLKKICKGYDFKLRPFASIASAFALSL